jgi:hypothetical protein
MALSVGLDICIAVAASAWNISALFLAACNLDPIDLSIIRLHVSISDFSLSITLFKQNVSISDMDILEIPDS